ncbi:type VI secretion system protein ImpL [Enterobacter sp. BIGb0383]|uniref:ImcF-related family protein n=1 Tax=unclassified Enterobacter TaxID=2608935 RepID=UPI000F4A8D69|nr:MULTISPECIES: ImcF-related family protein [unclassified Enterobacter]ROP49444.1 type VI secretion system protein ImpL [Enterobacter sp. BIGb0383]ROS00680.1 type VI secretion system protein ImpL [Enterobacter sp. BIGb0359]
MVGLIVTLLAGSLLWLLRDNWMPHSLARELGSPSLEGWLIVVNVLLLIGLLIVLWIRRSAPQKLDQQGITAPPLSQDDRETLPPSLINLSDLRHHLQRESRWGWKRHRSWLLLTGRPSQVEQIAPGLTSQGWLRCGGAVLLWGGDMASGGNRHDLNALRALRGRRPVDALIYAADDTVLSAVDTDTLQRGLWSMQDELRWQPPFYRLEVTTSLWPQDLAQHPLVAALSDTAFSTDTLAASLNTLASRLIPPGMQSLAHNPRQDYLLRLSSRLKEEGVARLVAFFRAFSDEATPLRLHGMLFTSSLVKNETDFLYQQRMGAIWRGITGHCEGLPGKNITTDIRTVLLWCLWALLALWGMGTIVSGASNFSLLRQTQALLITSTASDPQLEAVQAHLQALIDQQHTGTPWYRRFGMDISDRLPPLLWPEYLRLASARIALPARRALEHQLVSPSMDPTTRYDRLKALLMLSMPERTGDEAARRFLTGQLKVVLPQLPLSQLAWFAARLHDYPVLRITPDKALVSQARLVLVEEMKGPRAEAKRWQAIVDQARRHHADMSLSQLSGDADLNGFYQSTATVPGEFTRAAWEEQVRPAIEQQVQAIQEQTAWVLGPQQGELSPEAMRSRLRSRYFTEYAAAWQQMLNQITWTAPQSRTEQLAGLADPNRSPLIALMHELSWQGLAGSPDETRGQVHTLLEPVFGGLVAMEKGRPLPGDNGITLRQWISQAARLRDQMRNIDAASGRARALATSIFKGTQLNNSAAELPERIRNQLGGKLSPAGNALFIAPFGYAWQDVMQQGIGRMNSRWQEEIVTLWHRRFDGKYPFSSAGADANLAEIGEFIRPDIGHLAFFIRDNLQGVLEFRGNRWQVAKTLPPGLTVSPAFLTALNRLNRIGMTLFSETTGVKFRLQPETARDVVSTRLFIDGQRLDYANQMPFWRDIHWPGETYQPGTSLMWNSARAGARLYSDLPGQWGFIRLLAQAKVTPQGLNRYRLTWTAQDGLPLNYLLDAAEWQNPLDILLLQGFRLPEVIFIPATR